MEEPQAAELPADADVEPVPAAPERCAWVVFYGYHELTAVCNRSTPAPAVSTPAPAVSTPAPAVSTTEPSTATSRAASPKALSEIEYLWTELLYHPDDWYDNRADVNANPKSRRPDFKRKDDSAALWLDSKGTPEWVERYMGKRFQNPPKPWTPPDETKETQGDDDNEAPF